jgi:hypothetical protein
MKSRIARIIPGLIILTVSVAWCQGQAGGVAAAKQRAAELKQAVAANRAALMKHQWTQETQVNLKGETKKDSTGMRYEKNFQLMRV